MTLEKPVFDWSINLGHILTFVGFLFAGFIGFQNLDKRVVVLEQGTAYQSRIDAAQEAAAHEMKVEIKDTLKDIRNSVDKLYDKLDKKR